MASAKRVKRLTGMVLRDDLTLEVDAVAAVSGHRPSSSESPAPVNREPLNLSNPWGALQCADLGLRLHAALVLEGSLKCPLNLLG